MVRKGKAPRDGAGVQKAPSSRPKREVILQTDTSPVPSASSKSSLAGNLNKPINQPAESEEEISFGRMETEHGSSDDESSSSDEEDDDDEWENVWQEAQPSIARPAEQYKDISVTVDNTRKDSGIKTKGGVSQRERYERLCTHMLHVHCLTYFGFLRNRWLNDKQVWKLLVAKLPGKIRKGFEGYCAGIGASKKRQASSHDVLVKLLGNLMHYWKERFTITEPGLRKTGYTTVENLKAKLSSEKGEQIENIDAFRELAKTCKGSRDVGAQLFTALLRGLGVDSRLVFSLCPLGFGFSKVEMEEEGKLEREATGSSKKRKRVRDDGSDTSDTAQSRGFIRETKQKKRKSFDKDIKFPTFWTEVYDAQNDRWIPVDPLVLSLIATTPDAIAKFEPRGSIATEAKQNMCYVVAYTSSNMAKDVTVRYLKNQSFPGRTKGFRLPPMQNPDHFTGSGDWFIGEVMRLYRRKDDVLDEEDIDLALRAATAAADKKVPQDGMPETISGYKNHPKYVLERNLRKEEALLKDAKCIKTLKTGTGEKVKEDKVFERADVVACKSGKTWYMEGRVIKAGEQPLKLVKSIGIRRKANEDGEEEEPGLQGLYARFQTEVWKPPPVVDGEIPKNAYGNADCFRKSMIPDGAVHVNLKGAAKTAKKLGIDYAEAVTGFEFKKRRAVPLIEGVLVATENEGLLRDAWRAEEDERIRKADVKREKVSLTLWKKFLMGLRIIERVNFDYGSDSEGDQGEEHNPFVRERGQEDAENQAHDEDVEEGGFVRYENPDEQLEGGFLREENVDEPLKGGFLREEDINEPFEGGFLREGSTELPSEGGFLREETSAHTEASDDAQESNKEANVTSSSSPLSSLSSADFESDDYEEPPKKKLRRSRRR